MSYKWERGDYHISTDANQLDVGVVHQFLASSYWAKYLPLEVLQRSLKNSLIFGLYNENEQIGLARVITDYATFAYLADVFVLAPYRVQGLGK